MANIFSTNLSGTGAAMIFALKTLLKTAGWTVTQSGDATTYDDDGDVISHAGAGANGMANTRAWFVVRMPGTTRELCFQRGTTDLLWRVKYSRNAGFSGGSPSADTVPSASDQAVLYGSGTDSSPTGVALFHTNSQYYTQIMAQDSGRYGFWLASYDTSRNTRTAIMLDPLAEGSFPEADADPYVVYVALASNQPWIIGAPSATSQPFLNNLSTPGLRTWLTEESFSAVAVCDYTYRVGGIVRLIAGNTGAHAVSNEDVFLPVIYGCNSQETLPYGIKGVSSLMRINSNSRTSGDTTANLSHIQMGHVVLPWDGATIPTT